jgi:hypothetical protein
MDSRIRFEKPLDEILTKCTGITGGKLPTLAALNFPKDEYWRFFIEINRQNLGGDYLAEAEKNYTSFDEKKSLNELLNMKVSTIIFEEADVDSEDDEEILLKKKNKGKGPDSKSSPSPKDIEARDNAYADCPVIPTMVKTLLKKLKPTRDGELDSRLLDLTVKQLFTFTRGWLPFEATENGCVRAFVKELPNTGAHASQLPSDPKKYAAQQIKLIKSFYLNVTSNVASVDAEGENKEFRGTAITGCGLITGMNASSKGLREMDERHKALHKSFPHYFLTHESDRLQSTIAVNLSKQPQMLEQDLDDQEYDVPMEHKEEVKKTEKELKKEEEHQNSQVKKYIEEIMTHLLIEFYTNMQKKPITPIEKLKLIISLVRDMEQLHPFPDANCRTLCMLYLNDLLITNGFPPAILRDSNRFDGCTIDELLKDVIEGMRNTLDIQGGKKDLAGVTTEDVIQFLRTTPSYINELAIVDDICSPTAHPKEKKVMASYQFSLQDYYQALSDLKTYIMNHEWKVGGSGGSSISFNDNEGKLVEKTVPKTIFSQWKLLSDIEPPKNPRVIYKAVVDIAITSKSTVNTLLSVARDADTSAYLARFKENISPIELIDRFRPSSSDQKNVTKPIR